MAAPKRKRQPREFKRSELSLVDRMIEAGATQAAIAKAVGCSPSTLKRHFGQQLKGRQARGRRARIWSPQERDLVGLVAGLGANHTDIATMLGISSGEFQAAFAEELRSAKTRLDSAIGAKLVQKALHGEGDAVLLRFYARARLEGWNDRRIPEPPLPAGQREAAILRKTIDALDETGREAYRVVLEQLAAAQEGPGSHDILH
jgi:transposase-like protein